MDNSMNGIQLPKDNMTIIERMAFINFLKQFVNLPINETTQRYIQKLVDPSRYDVFVQLTSFPSLYIEASSTQEENYDEFFLIHSGSVWMWTGVTDVWEEL